jgi:hypothetical protein
MFPSEYRQQFLLQIGDNGPWILDGWIPRKIEKLGLLQDQGIV